MATTSDQFVDDSQIAPRVRELWATATQSADGGVNDTFYNSGGTSLSGLRLISALRAEFGVRLSWQTLRGAADADDLARRVVEARARLLREQSR